MSELTFQNFSLTKNINRNSRKLGKRFNQNYNTLRNLLEIKNGLWDTWLWLTSKFQNSLPILKNFIQKNTRPTHQLKESRTGLTIWKRSKNTIKEKTPLKLHSYHQPTQLSNCDFQWTNDLFQLFILKFLHFIRLKLILNYC